MKKLFLIIILAIALAAWLPVRPVLEMPQIQRVTPDETDNEKTASLYRVLEVADPMPMVGISVYCRGLPTDALAASQGNPAPSRVTFYFDGLTYVGAASTYKGAGEYFDLSGRSAAQIDGYTYEQWLAAN